MRKLTTLILSTLLLFVISCQKSEKEFTPSETPSIAHRTCAADEVLKQQMAADPALRQRMQDIEAFTERVIAAKMYSKVSATGEIIIPVIVHVLYNNSKENISDAQVQSQIDVLNADYNMLNKDITKVPSIFSNLKASVGIRFTLDRTIRKYTSVTSWAPNDNMKFSSKGGDDVIMPDKYLNMWVCNLGYDLLGYAQFPGGRPETDGVVIGYFCFGSKGNLIRPYDKGRTATHEVGHWMNLHHIWGDVTCGNDLVDDTPQATTYNFGCPSFPHYNECRSHEIEMTMNYMDYTDDPCMYMFTNGQKARMWSIFVKGGPRTSFAQ